jgi:Tfp pilus assembly protein PilV
MRLGNTNGLTLPEAIISCLILGLTLSGMLTAFVMCQKTVTFANNNLAAMHDARRLMETLITDSYSSSRLSIGTHTLTNTSYAVTENAGLKTIALTVYWVDPTRAASSSVTLVSSVASAVHP